MRRAKYYDKENGTVKCRLCPHSCIIVEGKSGICGVRSVRNGELETENYGLISSLSLDPVEKKPLYHYKPGGVILSAGSYGCNFNCGFCQNYTISKKVPETEYFSPEKLVEIAVKMKDKGNIGIAFTYNEPSIWYEYVYDTALLCKDNNLDVVLVTNGFISQEALNEIIPYVAAMNIDLKAFSEDFYKRICAGRLSDVLKTIELAAEKTHVEITTLLINGYNDSDREIDELSKYLSKINKSIPLHLSRYHPAYKFSADPTPVERVISCAETAKKYLEYVYIGNIPEADTNTYCPECGKLLVKRSYYNVTMNFTKDICPECGHKLNIIL